MIQKGSFLRVIDNSGGRLVYCIRIVSKLKRRYAFVGDVLVVSIKNLRKKRKFASKVKKGNVVKALVVRTKISKKYYFGDNLMFFENSVVLLNNNYKLIGTRIFGLLPRCLRYTRYMRFLSLCTGVRS
jgi:large subunit ribosomal protein L14